MAVIDHITTNNSATYEIQDTEARTKSNNLESTNYTDIGGGFADDNTLLVKTDNGMKKGFLNNFANWILDKLATKVYNQLTTSNKTMIGALNELNSNSFSTYKTDNTSQVILPVKSGGATVIIAYTLGGSGHDGASAIMALFRYSYDGTKCSINYIYNYGNNIIESSISNNKNTIILKNEDMMPITYLRVKTFDIL